MQKYDTPGSADEIPIPKAAMVVTDVVVMHGPDSLVLFAKRSSRLMPLPSGNVPRFSWGM